MIDNDDIEAIKIIDTNEKAEVSIIGKQHKTILKEIYSYILLIAIAFIAAQIIHLFLFTPVTVDGNSMNPNLRDKDVLFLSRLGEFQRLDVVVFKSPDTNSYYVKRLIGLPGDTIRYEDTQLYINEQLFEEPYADKPIHDCKFPNYCFPTKFSFSLEQICALNNAQCKVSNGVYTIPEGYYFVLGDNRNYSNDSRSLGLISEDRFIGEAKFILFPFNRFGKINSD